MIKFPKELEVLDLPFTLLTLFPHMLPQLKVLKMSSKQNDVHHWGTFPSSLEKLIFHVYSVFSNAIVFDVAKYKSNGILPLNVQVQYLQH